MALSEDFVDDPMFSVLARLSDCLCQELAAAGGPGLCYCGMWLGSAQPPLGLADCSKGDCGVAWVRVNSAFPSSVFPQPDAGSGSKCSAPMAYEVEIGVARCAPAPQGRDMFPDKQAIFDAQRLYMGDMRAAKRALLCCLPQAQRDAGGPAVLASVGQWVPLDNAGNRSGGAWTGYLGWA